MAAGVRHQPASPVLIQRTLQWDKLPEVKTKWYQETNTRHAVSLAFGALSLLTAGVSLFSARHVILNHPSFLRTSLRLLSAALALSALALRLMKPHPLDSQMRLKLRETFATDYKQTSYPVLKRLRDGGIITDKEMQTLLEEDIASPTISYERFMQKNTSGIGPSELLEALDQQNKALLKLKAITCFANLDYAAHKMVGCPESKALGITYKDLKEYLHVALQQKNISYEYFKEKHGIECFPHLSDEDQAQLKGMFQALLKKEIQRNEGATTRVRKKLSDDFSVLYRGEDPLATHINAVFEHDYSYLEFKERHGIKGIDSLTPDNKAKLKKMFQEWVLGLKLGTKGLQGYSSDFTAFGEDTKKEVFNLVLEQQLAEPDLDYCIVTENNAFKALLAHSEGLNKLREAFLRMPYSKMLEYQHDQQVLEITQEMIKEALRERWNAKSIQDVLKKEFSGFFFSLSDKLFAPSEWTEKVVRDTAELTVAQLIAISPELFRRRVLKADTLLASGKTLKEAFESEIETCDNIVQLFTTYSVLISDPTICPSDHPFMRKLVKEFLDNDQTTWFGSNEEPAAWNLVLSTDMQRFLTEEQRTLR